MLFPIFLRHNWIELWITVTIIFFTGLYAYLFLGINIPQISDKEKLTDHVSSYEEQNTIPQECFSTPVLNLPLAIEMGDTAAPVEEVQQMKDVQEEVHAPEAYLGQALDLEVELLQAQVPEVELEQVLVIEPSEDELLTAIVSDNEIVKPENLKADEPEVKVLVSEIKKEETFTDRTQSGNSGFTYIAGALGVESLVDLGFRAKKEGHYLAAAEIFVKALELLPSADLAFCLLTDIYWLAQVAGQPDYAIEHLGIFGKKYFKEFPADLRKQFTEWLNMELLQEHSIINFEEVVE